MEPGKFERGPRPWTVALLFMVLYFVHGFWYSSTFVEQKTARHPRFVHRPDDGEPYNMSLINSSTDYRVLVDRTDFQFLQKAPPCGPLLDLFLLVFVHSAPKHFEQRRSIRETWGNERNFPSRSTRLVFLVGDVIEKDTRKGLYKEHKTHGDIIQGNFIDSYRNLTYKHVMGLKWVTYYCRQAQYILKADDDIFVDIFQLTNYLKESFGATAVRRLIFCFLYKRPYVKRSRRSKWYVSVMEYGDNYYPSYCSGWGVIMSPDVVFNLYVESSRTPYFWVDDVLVTGILARKIGVSHVELNDKIPLSETVVQHWLDAPVETPPLLFGYPNVDVDTIYRMWRKTLQYYEATGALNITLPAAVAKALVDRNSAPLIGNETSVPR